jgi:outer membrane protein OmpA-like peptidoglycan-associated protein
MAVIAYVARSCLAPLLLVPVVVAGCAATPTPRELINARARVDEAMSGDRASLDLRDVTAARDSLARAERAFASEGDTPTTRGLAYVAGREADLALVRAETTGAEEAANEHELELTGTSHRVRAAKSKLLDQQGRVLTAIDRAVQKELRAEPERLMKEGLHTLASVALVHDEERATVVSMPWHVLFYPGDVDLRQAARDPLGVIASALDEDHAARVRIKVYRGLRDYAQSRELAAARGASIKKDLVARGVAPGRISSSISDGIAPEDGGQAATNAQIEFIVEVPSLPR